MIKCTLIDNETGEVLNENFQIETLEDKVRKKKAVEKDKLSQAFKSLQQEVLGNFVFFIFKNMDKLKRVLSDNDIVKLIYISTYIKSDGSLKLDNNITYIEKDKMKSLLKISDRKSFKSFYDKLLNNDILFEEDGRLFINLEYFYCGKETTYKKLMGAKLEGFTRIYIDTIRDLYINTPFREHKKLSIAYLLLPYVNWKYNVLCDNINETDTKEVQPVTIGDVMDILDYNKNQIARFKKDFYSITCKGYNVFMSVQGDADYFKSYIVVNPLVYYRGNDLEQLEYLIMLFGLKHK